MTDNQPLTGRRVLVVEDQYYLATDICQWLVEAGAEVVGPVRDAKQAGSLLETDQVDTGVVDINLGRGPTYEVSEMLVAHKVPFLFATGYDQAAIPPEYESVQRLEKPFKGTQLVEAVCLLHQARDGGENT